MCVKVIHLGAPADDEGAVAAVVAVVAAAAAAAARGVAAVGFQTPVTKYQTRDKHVIHHTHLLSHHTIT